VRLRHRLDGPDDAPVLVLANSLGTTLELWDRNVDRWTSDFRVLRYDARGHGGSDVPPGPYSVEQLGRDVLGLLDELGIDRASFCGTSLGGATGLWLAANAPERFERLVVACSSARFGEPDGWRERAELVRGGGVEAIADVVVSRWFTADAPRELVDAHRAMLVSTPRDGYVATCEAVGGWDFRDRLGEISADTLVIAAAEDRAAPLEYSELIAERVPSSRLVVLDRAAHLANVERADAFCELVVEHVRLRVEAA
jgi:3-oxoadipate enol-lactonase